MATRDASGAVLAAVSPRLPHLVGGDADLAPSTKTLVKTAGSFLRGTPEGRHLHFGVREHAMGSIANGITYHGGLLVFCGTFFVFSDYMRPAVRLAALSELPVVYVWTHDSIGVGEDGPTHEPVEHLASLRAMPNLVVVRPGDAAETVVAWQVALARRHGPTALVLTRQKVPVLDRTVYAPAEGLRRGAYVLAEASGRCARPRPDRDGLGGSARRRRADRPREGRRSRARRQHALVGAVRGRVRGLPGDRCCPGPCRGGSRWKRARPSGGTAGSGAPEPSWGSTASAHPRRARSS